MWKNKKFGFIMKRRSLPFGKGDGGMGRNDFDINFGSLIGLLLRRTLVQKQFYSTNKTISINQ